MALDEDTADAASSDTDENYDLNPTSDRYLMVPVPSSSSNSAVIRYIPSSSDTKPSPPPAGLFQRLWTDADEIELLKGFLDYTSRRGWLNSSHHHDTSAFYQEIRPKLNLSFNKSQLVEKIRRLKKKYRTIAAKLAEGKDFQFKTEHERAAFQISHKIWSFAVSSVANRIDYPDEINAATANTTPNLIETKILGRMECNNNDEACEIGARKRPREPVGPIGDATVATPVVVDSSSSVSRLIEETVRGCVTPVLKELVRRMRSVYCGGFDEVAGLGFGGMAMLSPVPLGFGGGSGGDVVLDEKWKRQRMLELEVCSKRIELVQDQIKSALEELRSKGS